MSFHPTLSDDLEAELMRVARQTGRNPMEMMNEAVAGYLENLEDSLDGEAVLERIRTGKEDTHSPDQVKHRLGLDV